MGAYARADYNLPFMSTQRVETNTITMGTPMPESTHNPMPESTLSPCQGLQIWPQKGVTRKGTRHAASGPRTESYPLPARQNIAHTWGGRVYERGVGEAGRRAIFPAKIYQL
jgi:hypothetical protein